MEREGILGLGAGATVLTLLRAQGRRHPSVLHKNLEDQAVYQAHPCQNWKDFRSC